MDELELLRRENIELRRENAELKDLVARLLAEVGSMRARVAELEAQLKQNSGNSSRSPSSDMAKPKRKPPVDRSGRKPGGQPGHEGKAREIVSVEQVGAFVDRDPETCGICGAPLQQAPRMDAFIRQVLETQEFQTFVTQYQLWRKRCPKCGGFTRGTMPPGSPKGAFGPRIQARVALLSGRFRLSRREVCALARELWNAPISLGSVQACCEAVSQAIAPTFQDLHAGIQVAPSVHADETGFGRCGEDRMWMWVAAGGDTEVFRLLPGRGGAQLKDLLGEGFSGHLHHDRWRVYEQLTQATHQICWAHLRRDIQSMLETLGETGVQGAMLKLASDEAFRHWHAFQADEIDRKELRERMKPLRREIEQRLTRIRDGGEPYSKKSRGTAADIVRLRDTLWLYLDQEGVDPTNNEAEQAIRKAVLWRKGSFGANSEDGCRFVERMLTLCGTARRRGIQILDWLTRAIQADLAGHPIPPFA